MCLIVLESERVAALRLGGQARAGGVDRCAARGVHGEVVADELSVPTVGMLTRRPLLFKQPAAFSLATGTAAAFPTATVEQEYGGKRRSQEVRAAAQTEAPLQLTGLKV